MSAAIYDLEIEQNSTHVFQLKIEDNGTSLNISDIEFKGTIKASIYDEEGFEMRFDKVDALTVNIYIDPEVSRNMDFKKGVYDISMVQVNGFTTRLLQGAVTNELGVS